MNDQAPVMSESGHHQTTYEWNNLSDPAQYAVLWDPILEILAEERRRGAPAQVFDLGCGNGITAEMLSGKGFKVTGVDPSEDGVAIARQRARDAIFHVGSGYDDLATMHGQFPIVICMEIIEHCYYPRKLAKTFFDLIARGG